MHPSKQKKIKFHALKHALSFKPKIHIQSNFLAFINALFKYKKSNFMYSNMHFHSNSKFRFNKKFHSFINTPLKKKNKEQKIKFHACKHVFSKFIFNKKFHSFINASSKESNFMHFHMHFSKRIENQISCTQTCIIIQTRNSYSTKICMHT